MASHFASIAEEQIFSINSADDSAYAVHTKTVSGKGVDVYLSTNIHLHFGE